MKVCRVQPDVPAVTRAFDYLVPEALAASVHVGAIVRVPLHGRRVRGWVVADDVVPETALDRLVPVHKVSSAGPPPELVDLARWAAHRWAGPVTAFLRAASPPTAVGADAPPGPESALHPVVAPPSEIGSTWPDAAARVVTWPPAADRRHLVRSLCAAAGSTLVLVPEPARAGALVRAIASEGREVLHHHSDLPDRVRSGIWAAAARGAQRGGRRTGGGVAADPRPRRRRRARRERRGVPGGAGSHLARARCRSRAGAAGRCPGHAGEPGPEPGCGRYAGCRRGRAHGSGAAGRVAPPRRRRPA